MSPPVIVGNSIRLASEVETVVAEMPGGDRDAVSAIRRAVGTRLSGPRIGPSTRCHRRDYEGTSSTLGTAVALLCLSEIKLAHTDDEVRRELA